MRTLLMARYDDALELESEPVIVDTDDPKVIVLELDDGSRLALDPVELRAAVQPARAAV